MGALSGAVCHVRAISVGARAYDCLTRSLSVRSRVRVSPAGAQAGSMVRVFPLAHGLDSPLPRD
jgi:hypothetical protein